MGKIEARFTGVVRSSTVAGRSGKEKRRPDEIKNRKNPALARCNDESA